VKVSWSFPTFAAMFPMPNAPRSKKNSSAAGGSASRHRLYQSVHNELGDARADYGLCGICFGALTTAWETRKSERGVGAFEKPAHLPSPHFPKRSRQRQTVHNVADDPKLAGRRQHRVLEGFNENGTYFPFGGLLAALKSR